jgi:hypothetical protein
MFCMAERSTPLTQSSFQPTELEEREYNPFLLKGTASELFSQFYSDSTGQNLLTWPKLGPR